jgi:NADH dehydrogenase I subunit E
MFCPKCDKFVPSSARRCPNCGIEIISGFSPNYGAGFDLGADDTESYSDALPRAADESDLYDDIPEEDGADTPQKEELSSGIGTKLKSLFGFGKK